MGINATYDLTSPLTVQFLHINEVGQIFTITFLNVSKNHDPSPLRVQKRNTMKYDSQTKIVSHDLGHTG